MDTTLNLNIGDKVKLERRPENSNAWDEVGKGVVEGLLVDSGGETIAIRYRDREWIRDKVPVSEIVMVNAPRFRAKKMGGKA